MAARATWLDAVAGSREPSLYGKAGSIVRISVPVHGNQPLKLGLARHLLRMAALGESDLL